MPINQVRVVLYDVSGSKLFYFHSTALLLQVLPQRNMSNLKVLHVMRTIHVIMNHTLPCAAKCFNSKEFILLKWKSLHVSDVIGTQNGAKWSTMQWMPKNITRGQRDKTFQFKIQSQKGKEHFNIMRWTQIHLHFCSFSTFNYWHCFSSMDPVRCYGMTIQIPYWSHCWVKHINL